MENTIEQLGGKEFMKSAKKGSLLEEMEGLTVFAPMDEAFTDFSEKMFENVSLIGCNNFLGWFLTI